MNLSIAILFSFLLRLGCCQPSTEEQLYEKLFKIRRAEQLEAVKSIMKLKSYEKQYKMISLMSDQIFTVIGNSKVTLENAGFLPGVSSFPADQKIREALSNILENTALFAEIVLRFPDISMEILNRNQTFNLSFQWSITFTNLASESLDMQTINLMNLASQELNYIERDPDYQNPYRRSNSARAEAEVKATAAKKKKAIKKGPKLSHTFDNEL